MISPERTVHDLSSCEHAVAAWVDLMSHYDLIQLLLQHQEVLRDAAYLDRKTKEKMSRLPKETVLYVITPFTPLCLKRCGDK